MDWRDITLHNFTGLVNSDLTDAGSTCRNPGNLGKKPWCFTKNSSVSWEYCNISLCPIQGKDFIISVDALFYTLGIISCILALYMHVLNSAELGTESSRLP